MQVNLHPHQSLVVESTTESWLNLTFQPQPSSLQIWGVSRFHYQPELKRVVIEDSKSTDKPALVSYLTDDLSWSPHYVLLMDEEEKLDNLTLKAQLNLPITCQAKVSLSYQAQPSLPPPKKALMAYSSETSSPEDLSGLSLTYNLGQTTIKPGHQLNLRQVFPPSNQVVYFLKLSSAELRYGYYFPTTVSLPGASFQLYQIKKQDWLEYKQDGYLPTSPVGSQVKIKLGQPTSAWATVNYQVLAEEETEKRTLRYQVELQADRETQLLIEEDATHLLTVEPTTTVVIEPEGPVYRWLETVKPGLNSFQLTLTYNK